MLHWEPAVYILTRPVKQQLSCQLAATLSITMQQACYLVKFFVNKLSSYIWGETENLVGGIKSWGLENQEREAKRAPEEV